MIKTNMSAKEMGIAKLVMLLQVMVGRTKRSRERQGAGDQPGEDYYEAEVSMMELEEALFKELDFRI